MPQTLLALLALSLSSLVVFNQQRLQAHAQTNMIGNEIQLASAGLASDIMAMIGARSFDEGSTPSEIHAAGAVPQTPDAFTQGNTFGSTDRGPKGCNLLVPNATPECDDVDDVDGVTKSHYDIELAEDRSLAFEVTTDVAYVNDAEGAIESDVPTRHKKVTIEVRSLNPGLNIAPLTFARVYSYDPIKAEMDYERVYGPIGTNGNGDGDGGGGGGTHTQN